MSNHSLAAQGRILLFSEKSVVTNLHGQNIICSKPYLDDLTHEQTIICTQLLFEGLSVNEKLGKFVE